MAASVIQVVHAENVAAANSIAVAITPTAGNSLIACVAFEDNTTLSSVKNTAGTAFNIDQTRDGTNEGEWLTISSLANVAGGATTITAMFAANANCCRGIQVLEVSGVAAAAIGNGIKLSGTPAGNDSGAGTALSFDSGASSTVTTVDDGALVIGYGEGDSHQPVVAGAYSLGANDTVNFLTTEYQVQGTHGAINPSYTLSVADKWNVVIAAYAPTAVSNTGLVSLKPGISASGTVKETGTATVHLLPAITASGSGGNVVTGTASVALKPTVTVTATNLGTFKLVVTITAQGFAGEAGLVALKPGILASGTMLDAGTGAVRVLLGVIASGVVSGSASVPPNQGGGYPSTKVWPFNSSRQGPKVVTHFEDGKPVRAAIPTPPAAPPSGGGSPRPIRRRRADLSPQAIAPVSLPPAAPLTPPHPLSGLLGELPRIAVPQSPKPPAPEPPPPPPPPKKLVLVTRYWGGLGLAMLAQRQGADVIVATDYRTVPAKERQATEQIGHGLVPRLPLEQVKTLVKGDDVLWVFDSNDLPEEADRLRAAGNRVIGTSALSQRLEEDREFGAEMAQAVGFDLPVTEQFHDYDRALHYLAAHPDQSFVYKPDAQDPTATYVPLEKEDAAKANRELQEYLNSIHTGNPSFILQEVVNGTEANFEAWVSNGVPLVGFCDLESKRKLVGDLGENLGCAGDYVFALGLDSPALAETVFRYLGHPRLRGYTGSVDANVMLKDGKVYFLENCFRFGYNAYGTIFQQLATGTVEDTLRAWVNGDDLSGAFKPGFGASLTLVCDHPKAGTPILIPPEIEEQVYQYRTYCDRDHCAMVEEWPEVAAVTAYGETMVEAGEACLEVANEVAFPGKGYRLDLASDDLPTLPIPRYQQLQEMGWVPTSPEQSEIAELTELLGVL